MLVLLVLTCAACAAPEEPRVPAAPEAAPEANAEPGIAVPVDSALAGASDEVASWQYRRAAEADLDADGQPERLVLTADAALGAGGEPMWEDGQRWAVYVESADTLRTLLYARFVQFGSVEAAVTEGEGAPHVTIIERGPHRRQAWEVAYG
jgi:hypothetical protein